MAARKLEASADSLFGKVQVGDLLLEVNGRDAKFSRSGSIDQTLNMMLQSGGDSRALVVTFRGRRDLHIARLCTLNRVPIDPNGLYEAVEAYGGFESIVENQWWQKVRVHMGLSFATSSGHQLRKAYEIYFGDLTDSHSKTVGGKVNGIKQSSVEETEANSSGDGGEEEAGKGKIVDKLSTKWHYLSCDLGCGRVDRKPKGSAVEGCCRSTPRAAREWTN